MPPLRDRGFSLVELLVVVTIIVILLALLAPAMDRAVEQAQRTVCSSNLHATGGAMLQYAMANKTRLPDGQPAFYRDGNNGKPTQTGGAGIYYIWRRDWANYYHGGYTGHGMLAAQRYADPKGFYCPSFTHPHHQYDKYLDLYPVTLPDADGGLVVNRAGGWTANNDPAAAEYDLVYTAYHYRACLDGPPDGKPWRAAKLNTDAGWNPIMADAFSGINRGVDQHHVEGYNVLRLDMGAGFISDPTYRVRDMNNGADYSAGDLPGPNPGYLLQKIVWEKIFAGH